jgi:hypothetical protein
MTYEDHKKIVLCYPPKKPDRNQIKPTDFLYWAKLDLKGGGKRERGNALGNIKKAIHSRIDEIINSTHLIFGSDWNWKEIATEKKLSILTSIGVEGREIARIITEYRNTYEHRYILPPLDTIRAYRKIAELWLNETYKMHNFNRIGIFDLPVYEVVTDGDEVKKIVLSNEYKNIIYFWDRKKEYIKTSKDKIQTGKKLRTMNWKDILSVEKGCIKQLRNKEIYSLSQSNLTKIFNMYNKHAMTKYIGFFKTGIHVDL